MQLYDAFACAVHSIALVVVVVDGEMWLRAARRQRGILSSMTTSLSHGDGHITFTWPGHIAIAWRWLRSAGIVGSASSVGILLSMGHITIA